MLACRTGLGTFNLFLQVWIYRKGIICSFKIWWHLFIKTSALRHSIQVFYPGVNFDNFFLRIILCIVKVLGGKKSCVVIGISDKISRELESDKLIGLRPESRALGRADPGPAWFLGALISPVVSASLGWWVPYSLQEAPLPLSPYKEFFPHDSCISRKNSCLAQSPALLWAVAVARAEEGVRELGGGKMSHPWSIWHVSRGIEVIPEKGKGVRANQTSRYPSWFLCIFFD